uniref:Uncharacterized protein n=1 Tax=Trichuris muris TaxID=70415 RepID=A0A5S6QQM1_TRIMR
MRWLVKLDVSPAFPCYHDRVDGKQTPHGNKVALCRGILNCGQPASMDHRAEVCATSTSSSFIDQVAGNLSSLAVSNSGGKVGAARSGHCRNQPSFGGDLPCRVIRFTPDRQSTFRNYEELQLDV